MHETLIIYLLWLILQGKKLEYWLRTISREYTRTWIKSLRTQKEALFPITKYKSHISHALVWPSSPTAGEPFAFSHPTFFLHNSQSASSTFSQPLSSSLPTSGQQINPTLKKYNPYLELESENILTLTLSQAPAFVCLYICTQSLNAAVFFLFVGMSGFHRSPAPLENTFSASD